MLSQSKASERNYLPEDFTAFFPHGAYFIAVLTDRVECGYALAGGLEACEAGIEGRLARLLELRIFDADSEYRLYRDDLASDFYERTLQDLQDTEYFDEDVYLDSDGTRQTLERNGLRFVRLRTTGGGVYTLPEPLAGRTIRLRTAIAEPKGMNGLTCAGDWRVIPGGKEGV